MKKKTTQAELVEAKKKGEPTALYAAYGVAPTCPKCLMGNAMLNDGYYDGIYAYQCRDCGHVVVDVNICEPPPIRTAMNKKQEKLMSLLEEWNVADHNQYVMGLSTNRARKLWRAVVQTAIECSHNEMVAVWIYASENVTTAGFSKHDVTTAYREGCAVTNYPVTFMIERS